MTITASNRDRFDPNSEITKWFVKSLQWQEYTDFEFLIADGGSKNYEEIKSYFESFKGKIPMRIVQCKIGVPFERAKLNNVGIRNSNSKYVMCTDVDMIFAPKFVSTLMKCVGDNFFVESRTLYIHGWNIEKIYKGEINPYNGSDMVLLGRIKKRTTAGGCQCTTMSNWEKLGGFNENYIGWGSEDQDLLTRVQMAKIHIRWMGESSDSIMLFHQPHSKSNEQLKIDLQHQENNKKLLGKIDNYRVNLKGWGGIYE